MEEYYHNGAYEIGVPDTLVHSVDEVVRLKVAGVRSRNEVISLDKLMDLHGKLVLIAGQQQGTVVDKFLEVSLQLLLLDSPHSMHLAISTVAHVCLRLRGTLS